MIQYEYLTHGVTVCCGARPRWLCYNSPSVCSVIKGLKEPRDGNEINHISYYKKMVAVPAL